MASDKGKLTDLTVKNAKWQPPQNAKNPDAKPPRMIPDGRGLYLKVQPGGARSWVFRYSRKINGKMKAFDMGLGSYPEVSLAEAREARDTHRKPLKGEHRIDPLQARAAAKREADALAKRITFAQAVDNLLAIKAHEFSNDKHRAQWGSTLKRYAVPMIGDKLVAEITVHDVKRCLDPIWLAKQVTAQRLRQRIEAVMSTAKAAGHFTGENPARWKDNLQPLFPSIKGKAKSARKVKHHAALDHKEIGAFMAALRAVGTSSAQCLEFAILTVARSANARNASWSQIIDLDGPEPVWRVDGDDMKAGVTHEVPLSPQAVALLKSITRDEGVDRIFRGTARNGGLPENALNNTAKAVSGKDITQHGFRASFKTFCSDKSKASRDTIEHALSHQIKDLAEAA